MFSYEVVVIEHDFEEIPHFYSVSFRMQYCPGQHFILFIVAFDTCKTPYVSCMKWFFFSFTISYYFSWKKHSTHYFDLLFFPFHFSMETWPFLKYNFISGAISSSCKYFSAFPSNNLFPAMHSSAHTQFQSF